ncbi:MAG TPA: hemolysin D [Pirellulaceae bacterium]|nr:hemolysin D [Pirellulaceae bacterium]
MDANRLVSTSQRPLRMRAREDLVATQQMYQGRGYWVVKDPLTLKYFRIEEEEYYILKQLDGLRNPAEIVQAFNRRFAPYRLTHSELFHLIGMFHRNGLILSDQPGQGVALWQRGERRRREHRRQHLLNVLSWRLRGIDPDRFLDGLTRYTGWFFSAPAALIVSLLILCALSIVAVNWAEFYQRLPHFREFFAGSNWFWLAVALSGTKIIHELGHGLACKRFGSQCHELGVMFLVFTPCLYCNVSDSWMLRSKWRRMAISAAGMYVELALAAIATFIWWASEPGIINQLALNVMFVSSVSTLLFNANPLMRFDGYYILCDWLEVPNLRQKASSLVNRWLAQVMLGMESAADPFLPSRHRVLFASYAVCAVIYRWLITFSIVWFLYQVLEPYGLQVIGQGLAVLALYSLLGMPLQQGIKYFRVPGRWQQVKASRVSMSAIGLCAVALGVLAIPLPHDVTCSCFVEVADAQNVFVERGGTIAEIWAKPNQHVLAGEPLIRLENPDLVRELRRMEGDIRISLVSYDTQLNLAQVSHEARQHLNAALAAYNTAVDRFEQRLEDIPKLTVTAPASGWLINPPARRRQHDQETLSSWTGTPLDQRNVGAYVEPQTLVALIAPDLHRLHCFLAVDQADIEFVQTGQPVKLWLNQNGDHLVESHIDAISLSKMREAPRGISHRFGGRLMTETADDGREIPSSAVYPALAAIRVEFGQPLHGATGQAKIRVGYRTIAYRLWRGFCQTFRFDLRS